ncbi:MAG: LacI family transcriptional regulator [Prevotellaceae bacterium]|jgi:LacI family transcriptional regulator|nr:LacI family transcriptional regulator [Prevotellaceae bacterium]
MPTSSNITIKDIAKALGISVSTVSRALNNNPDISSETIKTVQEYAKEHKYVPNALALGLKNQRSKIIGVIVPELANNFFSTALSGMETVAETRDYYLIVCQSMEEYEKEIRNVKTMLNARVCGVLVSMAKTTKKFDHFNELIYNDIPIVFFDRICPEIGASKVVVDDYAGTFAGVEYMISTGCKQIAFFHAPMNLEISKNRKNGFLDALIKNEIAINENFICTADTKQLGYQNAIDLLQQPERPDGFMCMNDFTATGVLLATKQLGLNVPTDVSIFGFSNSMVSQDTDPMLSTIDQFPCLMGEQAMNLLIDKIEKREQSPKNKIIKTALVLRDTTRKKA